VHTLSEVAARGTGRVVLVAILLTARVTLAEDLCTSQLPGGRDDVAEWVAVHHAEIVDRLLPGPNPDEALDLDTAWIAVLRITPANGESAETRVRMLRQYDGGVKAWVTEPVGDSIRVQLSRLRAKHPGMSPLEIAALVQMRTLEISQSLMRQPSRVAADLERLRGQYVFPNRLMLDATRYELWTLGGSQQTYITVLGPDGGEPELPVLKFMLTMRALAGTPPQPKK
jgi:hypothetical protein